MKKTIFSLTVLISFWSIPHNAHAAFPLPYTNTVALWLLDEKTGTKFNDATTNNNTGTFTADISFDTTVKKFGASSMHMTPQFSNEGGRVPDSTSFDTLTDNFTVEGWWLLTNSITGSLFPTLISRADAPRARTQWALGLTVWGRLLVQVFDAGGTQLNFTDPNVFPSNQFIHVAMTFSSGVLDLYENGSLVGAVTNASIHPSGLGRVVLGDYANAGNITLIDNPNTDQAPWRGFMDEIRISDIARIPGDGSGTGNFLAFNASLVPEPTAIAMSLLGLAWVLRPIVRRARR